MPQLHLYVRDEVAEEIRLQAEARGLPVSRILSELVEREFARGWPEGYFDRVIGGWKGEPLRRPDQGVPETREEL